MRFLRFQVTCVSFEHEMYFDIRNNTDNLMTKKTT